jgi:hypothetical protein
MRVLDPAHNRSARGWAHYQPASGPGRRWARRARARRRSDRLATMGSGLAQVAPMLSIGTNASCAESASSGGASPMFQSLLRRSVHGSSPSRDMTTQSSFRILMPDPYSDCEESSAPSRQHLRGASVTRTGNRCSAVDQGTAPCAGSARLLRKSFPSRHLFVTGARQTGRP